MTILKQQTQVWPLGGAVWGRSAMLLCWKMQVLWTQIVKCRTQEWTQECLFSCLDCKVFLSKGISRISMGLHHIFADVLGFSQQPTSPLLLWDLTKQSAQLVFILFEPIERVSKVLGQTKLTKWLRACLYLDPATPNAMFFIADSAICLWARLQSIIASCRRGVDCIDGSCSPSLQCTFIKKERDFSTVYCTLNSGTWCSCISAMDERWIMWEPWEERASSQGLFVVWGKQKCGSLSFPAWELVIVVAWVLLPEKHVRAKGTGLPQCKYMIIYHLMSWCTTKFST